MIIQRNISGTSGASEAIGFLLIFSIVMAGIGLVTLYGLPMLLQQQTGADEKIMEKNLIVLQNDFKSVVYKTIPYKETSLKIASGSLNVNRAREAGPRFRIGSSSGGNEYLPLDPAAGVPTGDLRYLSSQSQAEISLQNGAVVKRDLTVSGSIMLAQPRWFYDATTQTLVINIVTVNGTSSIMAREGIGTVQMELGLAPDYPTNYVYLTSTSAPPLSSSTVYVTYDPDTGQDYSTAWRNYFEKPMKMTCSGTSTLTCQTTDPVSILVIKRTDVFIRSV